jgi:hypothetical protein
VSLQSKHRALLDEAVASARQNPDLNPLVRAQILDLERIYAAHDAAPGHECFLDYWLGEAVRRAHGHLTGQNLPKGDRPADLNDPRWPAYWRMWESYGNSRRPGDELTPERQEDFNGWLDAGQPTGEPSGSSSD